MTEREKERAVAIYRHLKSLRKAVKALRSQRIFISVSGLQRIVSRVRETGTVRDRKRSGRPRKLDRQEERLLLRVARSNRTHSLRQLANDLCIRGSRMVSTWTIRRALKRKGYARRLAVKFPILTRPQKERRLAFALKYAKARASFWNKVGFSDEKIFQGGLQHNKVLVTRKSNERLSKRCVLTRPKRPIQVHVWGIISKYGMGPLRLVQGNLNSKKY